MLTKEASRGLKLVGLLTSFCALALWQDVPFLFAVVAAVFVWRKV